MVFQRFFQLQNFAAHVDSKFFATGRAGNGLSRLPRCLRTLASQVLAMKFTFVGQVPSKYPDVRHLRLAAQLFLPCRLRRATRVTSRGERIQLGPPW